jgi:1-aminocyclopropane-1-carboxylate deaminase
MYKKPLTQHLCNPLYTQRQIEASALRLDLVHPIISGNKWFKLNLYIQHAIKNNYKGLMSFGGAYSNHLVALATACREHGLMSIAIVRGEEVHNPSIAQMKEAGMVLNFVSRERYRDKSRLEQEFFRPDFYIVPEGGQGPEGVKGAEEILANAGPQKFTHILCSAGTGTTAAGIINSMSPGQHTVILPAIKINSQNENDLVFFLSKATRSNNYSVLFDYHFGGYAKYNKELITYMNRLYEIENIPTDFIYTAKLFYAAEDLTAKGYFPAGSKLLIIHSGGLQGNRSLPAGLLSY